jgi:hypothetical protein
MLQVKGGYVSEFASACAGQRRSAWGKARIWQVRKTGQLDGVSNGAPSPSELKRVSAPTEALIMVEREPAGTGQAQ